MCLQMFCKKIWSKNSFVGKKCFLVWPYQNSVKDYQNQFLDKILLQISLPKFGSEVWSKKMGLQRFGWDVWSKNAFAKKKRHFLVWLYQLSVQNYQNKFRAGSYFK